jgi:DNA invertase Pin-like site-specific DNA recombinase
MRAAVYALFSQDATGQRAGVTGQLEECQALADRLEWEVTHRYDDNDPSVHSDGTRPGFEAMLKAMADSEFGALICWHPDRLFRSMKDVERTWLTAPSRDVIALRPTPGWRGSCAKTPTI